MFISGYANTENVFYRLINCVLYNQNQRHGYSQWKGTKENDKNQSELEADYAASKKRGKTRVNKLRLVLFFFSLLVENMARNLSIKTVLSSNSKVLY